MKRDSGIIQDYDVVQNIAVAAVALWAFAKEYHDVNLQARTPALPLFMPVLPLVFHKRSVEQLGNRNLVGGLYRGLSSDRTISAGLQLRMERMAQQSFDAIMLACASDLLKYDPLNASLVPVRRTLPLDACPDSIRPLLGTARRLGHWFGELSIEQVLGLLRIRF